MAFVLIVEQNFFKNYCEMKPLILLGASAQCDICINSTFVGPIHGEFTLEKDKIYFRDLGSKNGSFINLKRIPSNLKTHISLDDICYLGDVTIKIRAR